jgi:hypothetical protein
MKTATIPSLRVVPELRQAAESLLADGETLSASVEKSIRDQIEQRTVRAAAPTTHARGWPKIMGNGGSL